MKYTEKTTSDEILEEFKKSIFRCLTDVDDMFTRMQGQNFTERDLAYKTRKIILSWFDKTGGL
jgi:hypothetical protein